MVLEEPKQPVAAGTDKAQSAKRKSRPLTSLDEAAVEELKQPAVSADPVAASHTCGAPAVRPEEQIEHSTERSVEHSVEHSMLASVSPSPRSRKLREIEEQMRAQHRPSPQTWSRADPICSGDVAAIAGMEIEAAGPETDGRCRYAHVPITDAHSSMPARMPARMHAHRLLARPTRAAGPGTTYQKEKEEPWPRPLRS